MNRLDELKQQLTEKEKEYDREAEKKKPNQEKLRQLLWEIRSLEQQITTAQQGGY